MSKENKFFHRCLPGVCMMILLLVSSCTDPIMVGAALFEEDQASVGFNDTLEVITRTIPGDSVRTYSPLTSQQLRSYRLGRFQDPVFGTTEASLYLQPLLERLRPDFTGAVLDSIVLVLPYDTTGFYGAIDEPFGIEVFRVIEDMRRNEEYYSNRTFAAETVPLGQLTFTPNLDSLEVVEFDDGERDTIRFPHIRIPLSASFGEELLSYDTLITGSDTTFLNQFKGLYLRPTTENQGLLSFNLITSAEAGIVIYYREEDLDEEQFKLQFLATSTRVIHYEHDYTGSIVAPYLENPGANDSLVFLQGLAGVNVRLEIPALDDLSNVAINFAELEVSAAILPEDDPDLFDRVGQILVYTMEGDQVFPVADLGILESRGVSIPGGFGGVPEEREGDEPDVYSFNITAQLQRMLESPDENVLFLFAGKEKEELSGSIPYKAARAWRSVLYGGSHPQYPIRLKVAYTRL